MFFNLFRRKTDDEIRIKAHAEGFAKAEAIMQKSIDNIRSAARDREEVLEREYEANLVKAKKASEKGLGLKTAELMEEIDLLKKQIQRDRKAWNLYKDYLPEASKIAHLLKADAYNRVEEEGSRFNRLGNCENSLEHLVRCVDRLEPKIAELMKGNPEVQRIMGNGNKAEE
jgi:predicted RNase H-like nuclease (RuvC/YqgF family)